MSFEQLVDEVMMCPKYRELDKESHHGITRLAHTMRVSKNVYKISKKLNLDYISATRASLLHDFFFNEDFGTIKGLNKGIKHPKIAANNAEYYFKLNEKEKSMIETHMFPLNIHIPKYRESWILTLVDKGVATYEYLSYKFSYTRLTEPINTGLAFLCIFLFNILTVGRK